MTIDYKNLHSQALHHFESIFVNVYKNINSQTLHHFEVIFVNAQVQVKKTPSSLIQLFNPFILLKMWPIYICFFGKLKFHLESIYLFCLINKNIK